MQGNMLAVLPPVWDDWTFESSWAFQGETEGVLGLAWISRKKREMKQLAVIYLAFVDCTTGAMFQEDSFPLESIVVENINLRPSGEHRWILTWVGLPFP